TEANGMYEVLEGLKAGDVVASSGVFLIAAEARISTAAKYWDNDAADGGAAASVPPPLAPEPMQPVKAPMPAPGPKPMRAPAASAHEATSPAPAAGYTCPMHPSVRQPGPGKCPICGMDLVPISGGQKP
ncbi:MAG TPA: heavy metal-binding domain-containing protein, partial [Polyangiaceae bacterium]|nr:heavy metal-binding domain-containing protein [Polyangiaceae bacterium]